MKMMRKRSSQLLILLAGSFSRDRETNILARRHAEAKLWTDALTADAKWKIRLILKGNCTNSQMWNALRTPMKLHSRIVFDHLNFGLKNSETALLETNKSWRRIDEKRTRTMPQRKKPSSSQKLWRSMPPELRQCENKPTTRRKILTSTLGRQGRVNVPGCENQRKKREISEEGYKKKTLSHTRSTDEDSQNSDLVRQDERSGISCARAVHPRRLTTWLWLWNRIAERA